jgi:hypothetical protein
MRRQLWYQSASWRFNDNNDEQKTSKCSSMEEGLFRTKIIRIQLAVHSVDCGVALSTVVHINKLRTLPPTMPAFDGLTGSELIALNQN